MGQPRLRAPFSINKMASTPCKDAPRDASATNHLLRGTVELQSGLLNQTLTADLVWQRFVEEVEERRNNVKRAPYSVVARRQEV
jgi:hypothetical protein